MRGVLQLLPCIFVKFRVINRCGPVWSEYVRRNGGKVHFESAIVRDKSYAWMISWDKPPFHEHTGKGKATDKKHFKIGQKLIDIICRENSIIFKLRSFQMETFKGATDIFTTISLNQERKLTKYTIYGYLGISLELCHTMHRSVWSLHPSPAPPEHNSLQNDKY